MAHKITDTDTMFSVGETPWHKLGTVLEHPPTIAEAMAKANLDWGVAVEQNYTKLNGEYVETPSRSVIKVSTVDGVEHRELLASVGPAFVPLANAKAFEFFQPWIDSGRVTLETAGTLQGQTRVWILAKIKSDPIVIGGDDTVEKYILLAHAHDGTLAIHAGLTPIRVVCNNTLSAALGIDPVSGRRVRKPNDIFRVLHRDNAEERLKGVAEMIEKIDQRLTAAGESYRFLASKSVTGGDDRIVEFVAGAFQQTTEAAKKGRRVAEIAELFARGQGQDLDTAHGTYWGLWNALSEYQTHHAGRDAATRSNSMAFGDGKSIIQRGLDTAIVMARNYSVAEVFGEFSPANMAAIENHPDAILIDANTQRVA